MSEEPAFFPNRSLPFYFGDLFQLKSELSRYELKGIHRIINVMAGQYAENKTIREEVTETSIFDEFESEESSQASRSESTSESVQKSARSAIANSQEFSAGVKVKANFGTAKVTSTVGYNSHNSKNQSKSEAQNFAKQVSETTRNSVSERALSRRSESTMLKEIEEQIRGLDNRGGPSAAMITRFVEEVYQFDLIQHQKHLFTKFIMPFPAAHYLNALEQGQVSNDTIADAMDAVSYVDPETEEKKILSPEKVSEKNWFQLASIFEVEEPLPPPEILSETVVFSEQEAFKDSGKRESHIVKAVVDSKTIDVPNGYQLKSSKIDSSLQVDAWDPAQFGALIGGQKLQHLAHNEDTKEHDFPEVSISQTASGKLELAVYTTNTKFGHMSLELIFEPTDTNLKLWKFQFYQQLKEARAAKRPSDNSFAGELDLIEVADLSGSPTAVKEMIQKELQRLSIQYVMGTELRGLDSVDRKAREKPPIFPNYPAIDFAKTNELQPILDFLNKVFDFEKMSHRFLPHYLGGDEQRKAAYGQTSTGIMNEFLTAGAVEILLPVAPRVEEQLFYFLQTGIIMDGPDIPLPYDKNFLALYDEIIEARQLEQEPQPIIVDSWDENMPTEHVMLQDGAAMPDFRTGKINPGGVSGNELVPGSDPVSD